MYLGRTIEDCINNISNLSDNIQYNKIESDLIATLSYLKDYKKLLDKEKNKESTKEIDEFFESIWKLYPNKKGKGQISLSTKKKLFKLGFNAIKSSIDNYKKDEDLKTNGGYKEYQNGSTFFRTGYVDYISSLDENVLKNNNKLNFIEDDL